MECNARVCKNCLEEKITTRNKFGICTKRKKCNARRARDQRTARLSLGLCCLCPEPAKPVVESRTLCQEHLDKNKEDVAQHNAMRKSYGLCRSCFNPIAEGRSVVFCEEHLKKHSVDENKRNKRAN